MDPIIEFNYAQCQRTKQTRERCKGGVRVVRDVLTISFTKIFRRYLFV